MNTPIRRLGVVISVMFLSLLISTTWVQFVSAGSLNAQPTNSRTLYKEYGADRGPIKVDGQAVAESKQVKDEYKYLRTYPGGALYAPVTGFYSITYGTTGLEATENSLLSGTADQLFYRRLSDLLTGREPSGATVELTLNAKAQKAAWNALGNRKGAVVALDPKTGAVLAMVSRPSYDPDRLASHDGAAVKKARTSLLEDSSDPLINRAIGGDLYAPGSTFKLVVAAAALENGYSVDSQLDGPASLDLPQTTKNLSNDEPGNCGPGDKVSLADALKISCNTAFAKLGMDLGASTVRGEAEKFGFGQKLSVPLAVTPSSFPAELNEPQLAQSSIGQYDVRVTPLQVAMISAAIANDGVLMRPNLISKVLTSDAKVVEQPSPERLNQVFSSSVANDLTSMMELVVQSGTGTRAQISGVDVAGKTGTAQHPGQSPDAWFTSFAPANDPEVAVAVVVENGGGLGDAAYGGTLAAPIAKQVMEAVMDR
ncbi:peptidoglycan D,D-transpeptidase FtsI family protein [Spongisporangium articulatum]|uniref:Peptidoglycan D,D-transpeptidase FtsI family protein n=1 Tax=Spongisporangium articulatum TaxID=3362603 RepID=A0ABW8AI48_9ACTN